MFTGAIEVPYISPGENMKDYDAGKMPFCIEQIQASRCT